jgi:hypothetical protein
VVVGDVGAEGQEMMGLQKRYRKAAVQMQ